VPSRASDPDRGRVEARPPRGPLRVIGLLAAVTVPLALAAAVLGDGVLGLVGLASAAWAGSLAYLGWTARAVADAEGVEVRWMRTTQVVDWAEVAAVEVDRAGPGGMRRGVVLIRRDGGRLRWIPWIPFLWFAHRASVASAGELGDLLGRLDVGLDLADPDAPADDRPSWTRSREK